MRAARSGSAALASKGGYLDSLIQPMQPPQQNWKTRQKDVGHER